MNRFFNTLFWLLFGLRIVRLTAPWLAGIFVALLLVMFLPMPPLLAVIAFIVCAFYIGLQLETKVLRDVRAAVVNALSEEVSKEDAAEPWARDATQSSRIEKQAFEQVMHKRHGKKLVVRSVNDPEANHTAASHGYEILAGGALTGSEWKNAKRFESFQATSQVFPTDNPTSGSGSKSTTIPQEKWTPGMRRLAEYVERIGRELVGGLIVRIVRDSGNRRFSAWYGGKEITFNLQRVGHRFFNDFPANMERVNSLLLHELAHERESDHLSDKYHSAICDYGARLTQVALERPKLFKARRARKTKASQRQASVAARSNLKTTIPARPLR